MNTRVIAIAFTGLGYVYGTVIGSISKSSSPYEFGLRLKSLVANTLANRRIEASRKA